MNKTLVAFVLVFMCSSVFAKKYHCHNEGNSSVPAEVVFSKWAFFKVTSVKISYDRNGRRVTEIIQCQTNGSTVCNASAQSLISRVILHPRFGASYTIKGEREIAQFLRCN